MALADGRPTSSRRAVRFAASGILALVMTMSVCACQTPAETPRGPAVTTSPTTAPTGPGLPAIATHRDVAPAFTAADVQKFLATYPLPGGLVPTGRVVARQVSFMTSTQASRLIAGETTGLPGQALVCYVVIAGGFTVQHGPPGGASGSTQVPTAVLIFDAGTGNLLVIHTE